MNRLSIIICTYNRSRLLKKCLDSLSIQLNGGVEVIVVDNNSNDDTVNVFNEFSKTSINYRYILETKIGLSHARNRGIIESKSEWILYLDDDVIALPTLVQRALYLVERGDFDCVGGKHYETTETLRPPWYLLGNLDNSDHETTVESCNFGIPIGCVVLYRKICLERVGMFKINLGMKGNKIGYGEETELQLRLKKNGYNIGFDPLLEVFHIIREDKLKLLWHLKSAFALGRDGEKTKNAHHFFGTILLLLRSTAALLYKLPKSIIKVLFIKTYYWQNAILDSFWPIFYRWGQVKSKLL